MSVLPTPGPGPRVVEWLLRPCGDRAVLLELADPDQRRWLDRALASEPPTGLVDLVPALRTILLTFDSPEALRAAAPALANLAPSRRPDAGWDPGEVVEVPVRYDGADLDDVADLLAITPAEVVARHARQLWTVDFAGFTPGFGYLTGDARGLTVPRLATPRTRVPAGSVALADDFSGVYPTASPGGWRLIGSTDAVLWNLDRTPPALLAPGRRVRFVEVGSPPPPAPSAADDVGEASRPASPQPGEHPNVPVLRVERPGMLSLVQDLGRPGHARFGVSASGAWDRAALRLANRLVGNPEDAAGVEALLGGLSLTALTDTVVAVTGADTPLTVDGRAAAPFAPVVALAGARIVLGTPTRGLRCYLAVRGGIAGVTTRSGEWVGPVFGSLASQPAARLGPAPLTAGDVLVVSPGREGPLPGTDLAASALAGPGPIVLRVQPGPRDDWFAPDALDVLASSDWTVAQETDRIGTRLVGPALPRARAGELASEPLVRGAVQVPASGQPLVFGPDHPTTGGYPVIGCVIGEDADALAQAPPGTLVRFEVRRP